MSEMICIFGAPIKLHLSQALPACCNSKSEFKTQPNLEDCKLGIYDNSMSGLWIKGIQGLC